MALATALPRREELALEQTWNLESIYADNDQWEADFQRVAGLLPQLQALAGTLGASGEALLYALQQRDAMEVVLERLFAYALYAAG